MKKSLYFILPIITGILVISFLFTIYNKPISADSCPFVNDLHIGDESNEVALLQLFLVRTGYYKEALITGYFGNLTSKAVKNFQKANGVYTAGFVGPDTRKALCSKYTTSCPFVSSSLKKGVTSSEVKMLQLMLISQTNFPSDMITGYFGPLTESHLKAFQSDNNLIANGIVDFNTQQKLCTLYTNTITLMSSNSGLTGGGNIDLAVSDLSYAPTQNIQVGSTIIFGIKEKNLGISDAPAHSYDLYINEYRLVSENLSALKSGQERAVNIQQ
ncbi:MAG TPA: peptidoglycan-binding protein [Candidatus Paceibacterota bacterium]|nr:peptidoglycan-binding protein [Candidatus Paceibacterota bacterium]